jgi:acyl carrier protein
MPATDSLQSQVSRFLIKPLDELDPATPLHEAILDSFALAELALALESDHQIVLTQAELARLATVADLKVLISTAR